MDFAILSPPSVEQLNMAAELGHTLHEIDAHDPFMVCADSILNCGPYEGVVVNHPAASLRLAQEFVIGVFETDDQDRPRAFNVYDLRA